jgi:hypothetical protein
MNGAILLADTENNSRASPKKTFQEPEPKKLSETQNF